MKLVLIGATGKIGTSLLNGALERDHEVLAIAKQPENIKTEHKNLEVKDINIFDEDALAKELRGKDSLVSCIGAPGSLLNSQEVTLYIDSVKLFANALRKSSVTRLVVMSAWYSEDEVPFWMRRAMKPVWLQNVVECMKYMEVVLDENCSDLDYTAVKVGIGRGDDESGKPILAQEGEGVPGAGKFITYGDVSKFILEQCLEQGEWKKKIVSIGT